MLFIDAVPGCETRNFEFFLKNNFADMRDSVLGLCDAVCDMLENGEKLKNMSETLKAEFDGCAVQSISEYIIKDIECTYGRL